MEILVWQVQTSSLTSQGGDLGLDCGKGNLQNAETLILFRMDLTGTRKKEQESFTASQCSSYVDSSGSCAHGKARIRDTRITSISVVFNSHRPFVYEQSWGPRIS
jgi:3'-phosphoadenosine 5'-phosphosulfate sulfotransferase